MIAPAIHHVRALSTPCKVQINAYKRPTYIMGLS